MLSSLTKKYSYHTEKDGLSLSAPVLTMQIHVRLKIRRTAPPLDFVLLSGGARAVGHGTHRSLRPFVFSRLRTALDPSLSALLAAEKPTPRRPQRTPTADTNT